MIYLVFTAGKNASCSEKSRICLTWKEQYGRRVCSLNPRIRRWIQRRVRVSPAETNSRCRHRWPQSPPLCLWHCHSRQCGCRQSILGRSHKGLIWSPDKAGWVGQAGTRDGERRQVWTLLGLEELKNCQIARREGICCKRQ